MVDGVIVTISAQNNMNGSIDPYINGTRDGDMHGINLSVDIYIVFATNRTSNRAAHVDATNA